MFVTFLPHLSLPAHGVAPFSAACLCTLQFDELLNIVELAIVFSCMSSTDFSFSWMRQAHPVKVFFLAGSVTHLVNLSYYTANALTVFADSQPTLHVVKAGIYSGVSFSILVSINFHPYFPLNTLTSFQGRSINEIMMQMFRVVYPLS